MKLPTPDLAKARAQASIHLATVVDPSGVEPIDDAHDDVDDGDDALALVEVPSDPTQSSLMPAVVLGVAIASNWVANKWGPQWLCTEERAERIARPVVRLIHKYFPEAEGHGEFAELGVALFDYALAGMGPALNADAVAIMSTDELPAPVKSE